jgi:hypothetical protein
MTSVNRTLGAAALGAALLLCFGPLASQARAGYIVMLEEMGSDVVATGNGPIDLTGLTSAGTESQASFIWPARALIVIGPTSPTDVDIYTGFTGPTSFGSNVSPSADSGSGPTVGISGFLMDLFVPEGYFSNAPLSNTATFLDENFDSLDLTQGTYEWTWGTGPNQNFTLIIGAPGAAISEPASASLLGAALAGLLLMGTIRRTRPDA